MIELSTIKKGDKLVVTHPNYLSQFYPGDVVEVFDVDTDYPYVEVQRYYATGWLREPMLLEELSLL